MNRDHTKENMSTLLKEKRSTRGLRMSELVGEALEQDAEFYEHEIWAEEESDDSYEAEEIKPDEFDSDFNDSEDDDDSDDDEEEVALRKTERSTQRASGGGGSGGGGSGRYKEPAKPKFLSAHRIKGSWNKCGTNHVNTLIVCDSFDMFVLF